MRDDSRFVALIVAGGALLTTLLFAILLVTADAAYSTRLTRLEAAALPAAAAPAEPAAAAPAEPAAAAPAEPAAAVSVSNELIAAFNKGTCIACHMIPNIPNSVGQVGPNLATIGTDAATRVPGQSAVEYIHESIVNPLSFTAPTCPFGACVPGTMPPGLDKLLSAEELTMMVDYLAGLKTVN